MNLDYLRKIREELKRQGLDFSDVAERIGVSRQCISQNLNAKLRKVNPKVIETALVLIEEKKAFNKNVKRRVDALIEN